MNIGRSRTLPNIPPQVVPAGETTSKSTSTATQPAKDAGVKFGSTNDALTRLAKQQPPPTVVATSSTEFQKLSGFVNGDPKVIEELRQAAKDGNLALVPLARQLAIMGVENFDLSTIFDTNKLAEDLNKAYGGDVDAWARAQKTLSGREPSAEEKKNFEENPFVNWLSNERQFNLIGATTRPPGHIKRGEELQDALKKANPDAAIDLGLGDMIPSPEVNVPGLGTIAPERKPKTPSAGASNYTTTSVGSNGTSKGAGGAAESSPGNLGLAERPQHVAGGSDNSKPASDRSPASSSGTGGAASTDGADTDGRKQLPVEHHHSEGGTETTGKAFQNADGSVDVEWSDGTTNHYDNKESYEKGTKNTSDGNTTVEVEKPAEDDSSSTEHRDPDYMEPTSNPLWDMRRATAPRDPGTSPYEENPVLGIGAGDTVTAATNPYVDLDQALQTTGTPNRHAPPVDPHRDPDASAAPGGVQNDPSTQERR